jgi:hypothetical protein
MKLYPRELASVKDLDKEKKRLKKELRKFNNDPLFQFGKPQKSANPGKPASTALSPLSVAETVYELVTAYLKRRKKKTTSALPSPRARSVQQKVLQGVIEVVSGYLKWKATMYAVKQVITFSKSGKTKK